MGSDSSTRILEVVRSDQAGLLEEWMRAQEARGALRPDLVSGAEHRREAAEFLKLVGEALASGVDARGQAWAAARDFLSGLSRRRVAQGFSPSETATFVLSLKEPIFTGLRSTQHAEDLAEDVWTLTMLIDDLALYTTEVFQKGREEMIQRQQQELLELSTPVIKLWQGILAVPLIGTLDSARTQVVMESLLQEIVSTESSVAIIDITGVPTVDTLVAQHLIKTVEAARLMGAECIISGIRPQIAQTIVHLGIDLRDTLTKATLADAIAVALQRAGLVVRRANGAF